MHVCKCALQPSEGCQYLKQWMVMGVFMFLYSFLLSLERASSKLWHDRSSMEGMAGTGSQLHSIGPALDVAASRLVQ